MAGGYTKLFSDILTSSIWNESEKTRILWITMLAMCDAEGYIHSSLGSLAHMARLSVDDTRAGLEVLEAPDDDSRSSDHDGRRVERIEGGWFILNYENHRNRLSTDPEAIAARKRKRKQRERDKERDVTGTSRDTASASASGDASEFKLEVEIEGQGKDQKEYSETEKRRVRVSKVLPVMKRVGAWFGRQEDTKWTLYEVEAWGQANPTIEEVNDLELYYTVEDEKVFRRGKLETLLNNWQSEVDKARCFIAEKNRKEQDDGEF